MSQRTGHVLVTGFYGARYFVGKFVMGVPIEARYFVGKFVTGVPIEARYSVVSVCNEL
jgi:hypothetical protein